MGLYGQKIGSLLFLQTTDRVNGWVQLPWNQPPGETWLLSSADIKEQFSESNAADTENNLFLNSSTLLTKVGIIERSTV